MLLDFGGESSLPRLWKIWLAFVFCTGALGATWAEPQVLVLASYHPGLAWTDNQLAGLRAGIAKGLQSGEVFPELHVEYLDTKRVPPTAAYFAHWRRLLAYKHGDRRFAAVVAQDDDALDFVLAERRQGGLFENLPVVFSGVAGKRKSELEGLPAITGVFDDADVAANVALLRKLRPNLSRVVFVHDQSRTGRAQAEQVQALAPQFPGIAFEFLSALDVAGMQARLAALDAGAGVFLLTFNIDAAGRVLSHEEASRLWAEASPVPVLVKEDVMLAPGVLGGLVVTGPQQGELAAAALLHVLRGGDARALPMHGGATVPIFAYEALQRFAIDADLLPANAIVRGKPERLYDAHPREAMLLLGLIAALLALAGLAFAMLLRTRRQRAEATERERSYREVLNATSEAIFIHAPDGTVLDVNDRFCAMYGYARSELGRLNIGDLSENVAPYAADDARQWLMRALNEGPQLFEWRARRANGELFWVEVALRRTELLGELRLIAAVRDISQRKAADAALKESEARYALILQKSPVGIVHFDTNWAITFCNERFAEIVGAGVERLAGLNIRQLRDPAPLHACGEALAGRQGDYQGPYHATLSDLHIWVDVRTAPLFDAAGKVIGGIAIVEDITRRIEAEQALRALNEALEQRVAERTAALSAANEDLRQAMKRIAQSEKLASLGSLVAGVAHELNTPIGNARTVASTLHDHVTQLRAGIVQNGLKRSTLEGFLAASDEAASLLERNLARAAELIGNFKQVAVDQTSMRRRRFDLRQVCEEVLATLQPKLRRHPFRVALDVPEGVELDSYPGPLEQVLTNFILNSLIHGFAGRASGEMRIAAAIEGDSVRIDYSDDGAGMSENAAARAFDPFFTTRLGQGGSGLGLYIVHNLVTGALGGSITLATSPGAGVRFTLRLPRVAPVPAIEAEALPAA